MFLTAVSWKLDKKQKMFLSASPGLDLMVHFYSYDILTIQHNSIAQKIDLTDFVNKIFLNAKLSVLNDMKKMYL